MLQGLRESAKYHQNGFDYLCLIIYLEKPFCCGIVPCMRDVFGLGFPEVFAFACFWFFLRQKELSRREIAALLTIKKYHCMKCLTYLKVNDMVRKERGLFDALTKSTSILPCTNQQQSYLRP
jgi:hypothetical protein